MNDKRRFQNIFKADGRSLIVAMDHGSGFDVYPALSNPAAVIEGVVQGGADALLSTIGLIKRFHVEMGAAGILLRMDGGGSQLSESPGFELLHNVEDAIRVGADGVVCMGFPGTSLETQTLSNIAALAGQCQNWGIPLMAEMLPGGFTNMDLHTAEHIRLAARIGVELGADFIKTEFTGSGETFRTVVDNCYQPILILGGSKLDDERALFSMVKSAMDAGGAGAVIGRNIWGHQNPRGLVEALSQIIHGNASIDEALHVLNAR